MTAPAIADEVLADPVGLIVRLVGNVEKYLHANRIRGIVCTLVRTRAGCRNLAQALRDNPALLRTGEPPAPHAAWAVAPSTCRPIARCISASHVTTPG